MSSKPRDGFSSKFGVIAAAAGSAVGLGNIWKFPYEAGQNGGGAFLLLYFVFVILIGLPVMMSEFVIGRKTNANAVGAFKSLAPKTPWFFTGVMGVAAAFMILSFYGVVSGWTLEYIYLAVINAFKGQNPEQLSKGFNEFISNPIRPVFWQVGFMTLTALVVIGGIKNGIEKITKLLMPILFLLIVVIGIRSVSLGANISESGEVIGHSYDGLKFLFKPDFSKIDIDVVLDALGQAFFSLSLGMGTIITYGSYIKKDNNLKKTAIEVAFLDTLIAVLAGVAIFPAVFYFNVPPTEGPGLVFSVLPSIFQKMAGGYIWTLAFFVLFAVAALTSSISLLEVAVAYFTEELKINRLKATIITAVSITALGVACSLSNSVLKDVSFFGRNIFDTMDHVSSNFLLPIGGMLIAIFTGWVMKQSEFYNELSNNGTIKIKLFKSIYFIIRFLAPVAIAIVFLYSVGLLG
ncbi:sodium-dependent transporter [Carboxylicivirga sp. M1479]|uniref:sodium-dependent transporter n=1 Tax=Carboxylicivirga sp. M1479 TaxID=2594476 RepID=UPI001178B684|nr:sodium-dependent transporter [Carboxylicivirga sp. M1479]TRX64323.1 sodium-dependent transporter [Carboxylicivirga sp. M1479]